MDSLTSSALRCTWAISLFGVEHMSRVALRRNALPIGECLDSVSVVVSSHLGNSLKRWYRAGDDAQRGFVDFTSSALRLDFGGLLRPALDMTEPVAELARTVASDQDFLIDWQELRNKAEVFDLVRNVESRLGLHEDDTTPLSVLVHRAYDLGDFPALWAIEGLGHFYAQRAIKRHSTPCDLLTDPVSLGVPDTSLTMLNAGIGLAFAKFLLDSFDHTDRSQRYDRLMDSFVTLCRTNATPGYTGAALESLGLVARTFHPRQYNPLSTYVDAADSELSDYFWHGAGRATYFARENFVPCCGLRWNIVMQDACRDASRRNLLAGLAWAFTLVNMCHPTVMEKELCSANRIPYPEAFANGVSSCIVVRSDVTPNAPFLGSFCAHRPLSRHGSATALWEQMVSTPCVAAMNHYYPSLKGNGHIEEAFRFQRRRHVACRNAGSTSFLLHPIRPFIGQQSH